MKHLKHFKLFESNKLEHPGFPKTEDEIHSLCKNYEITNYRINEDLSIDVNGDVNGGVNLSSKNLNYLPLKFNKVGGSFNCYNNKLKSLKGCPSEIGSSFVCSYNNIRSLNYFPIKIENSILIYNNPIYSLIENFIYKDNRIYLAKEFEAYGIISRDETTVYWNRYFEFCDDYNIKLSNIYNIKKHYKVID